MTFQHQVVVELQLPLAVTVAFWAATTALVLFVGIGLLGAVVGLLRQSLESTAKDAVGKAEPAGEEDSPPKTIGFRSN